MNKPKLAGINVGALVCLLANADAPLQARKDAEDALLWHGYLPWPQPIVITGG